MEDLVQGEKCRQETHGGRFFFFLLFKNCFIEAYFIP